MPKRTYILTDLDRAVIKPRRKKLMESDIISSSSSPGITSKADTRTFRWCMARAMPTAE
jgi:hypothetical protein